MEIFIIRKHVPGKPTEEMENLNRPTMQAELRKPETYSWIEIYDGISGSLISTAKGAMPDSGERKIL